MQATTPQDILMAQPFNFAILDTHLKNISDHCLSDEVIDAYLKAVHVDLHVSRLLYGSINVKLFLLM